MVGERVAFQVALTPPPYVSLASLPFVSSSLYFSHRSEPVVVYHSGSPADGMLQRVDVGNIQSEGESSKNVEGVLRWNKGGTVVFSGTVVSETPATLKVRTVALHCTVWNYVNIRG